MRTQQSNPKRERGVMLIEALIAILIFSIGILAVVGMQSVAIKNVTDAKIRSDAGFLVGEIMAQMWNDSGNLAAYAYTGSGSVPPRLAGWMDSVNGPVNGRMPGGLTPIIWIDPAATVQGGQVLVTVRWQLPQEASLGLPPHQHVVLASINRNPPP